MIPFALAQSKDISFVICVSCAGMSGQDQTTYQAMALALCSGTAEDKVEQRNELLAELDASRTYETYPEYVHYREVVDALFNTGLVVPETSRFGIIPEEPWLDNDTRSEGWWNPIAVIEQTTIPILAIFGATDPQIDPLQGAYAYREALQQAGNPYSRVELFPAANHGIFTSETGCPEDETFTEDKIHEIEQYLLSLGYASAEEANKVVQEDPYSPESLAILTVLPYAPGYLDLIEEWLTGLQP